MAEQYEILITINIFSEAKGTEPAEQPNLNKEVKLFNGEDFMDGNKIIPKFSHLNPQNAQLFVDSELVPFNYLYTFTEPGEHLIAIKFNHLLYSLKGLFANCIYITKIQFLNVRTDEVVDMSYLFYNCWNLKEVDLRCFDTKNVVTMNNMFSYCHNLKDLDLMHFDAGNCMDLRYLCAHCNRLNNLKLSLTLYHKLYGEIQKSNIQTKYAE